MKFTMGIDQYGHTHHDLGKHPRKELLKRLGRSKAARMYEDGKDGTTVHCGYVIGKLWIRLYEVTPLEVPVNWQRSTPCTIMP